MLRPISSSSPSSTAASSATLSPSPSASTPHPHQHTLPSPASDALALRRRFQSLQDGSLTLASLQHLLDIFLTPLEQCYPDHLPSILTDVHLSPPRSTAPRARIDASTAAAAQHALLRRVVVDWGPTLDEHRIFRPLLHAWFFGSAHGLQRDGASTSAEQQRPLITPVSPDNEDDAALSNPAGSPLAARQQDGTLQLATLRTLSALLSSGDNTRDGAATEPTAIHAATCDVIRDLCRTAVEALSLPALLQAVRSEPNRAKRTLAWEEAVRLLVALPDRLANFTQGEVEHTLQPPSWYSNVVINGLVELLLSTQPVSSTQMQTPDDSNEVCAAAAVLLTRLERAAYLSAITDQHGGRERGFWPSFVLACRRHLPESAAAAQGQTRPLPDALRRAWTGTVACCSMRTQERIDTSLFAFIDDAMKRRQLHHLVAPQERGRPGNEGSRLLGKQTVEFIGSVGGLLLCLYPVVQRGRPNERAESEASGTDVSDEDDSDDEDEDERQAGQVFERIALASTEARATTTLQFGPAMGWLLSVWMAYEHREVQRLGLETDALAAAFEATVKVWSQRDRIGRALLDQEQYLTLLLIGLLASQPAGAPAVMRTASLASFIDGVSCHLEHSDPHVRRLGMLVAEMVSTKSRDTTCKGDSAAAKPLSFGRATWDGKGQGREEARVIRALHDGWQTHWRNMERHVAGQESERQALERCIEVLQLGSEESKTFVLPKEGAPSTSRKVKAPPTTVRLPPLRPAPPRKAGSSATRQVRSRPLIASLSDDDDDDDDKLEPTPPSNATLSPLKMFDSNRQVRYPGLEDADDDDRDSTSSSDDEEDSSDDEEADQDEATRLAADLSGLTTEEASRLTRQAGLGDAGAKEEGGADTFDATREAHAPSFTKKRASRPVYISDLSPLLKSNDRQSIRTALRECATLVARKAGWGYEVRENAIDLTLSLCGLHNNFGMRKLEQRRGEALVELVVAAPEEVMGCLAEAFFNAQYAMVQKVAMVEALARGARRLAGREGGESDKVVEALTHRAIERAQREGEERVPDIRRWRKLEVREARRPGGSLTSDPAKVAGTTGAITSTIAQTVLSLLLRFSAEE
ncbi:telomere binding protein [Thecaphora frezii]